jgi:hypothetical protein
MPGVPRAAGLTRRWHLDDLGSSAVIVTLRTSHAMRGKP